MQCARLHLQERPKTKPDTGVLASKPRRYCQKRMINPDHDEDPRWTDVLKRFHCNDDAPDKDGVDTVDNINNNTQEMYLTVQTLQFQGDIEQPKRSRSSFKYKADSIRHRMFVKQLVLDNEYSDDDDRQSEITSCYFDDYLKYLFVDKPPTNIGKSNFFLQGLNDDNKTIKFEDEIVKEKNIENEAKSNIEQQINDSNKVEDEDTKITYSNTGRRKSLTLTRTQSPETVQVIRVDVVCNYSSTSSISNYDDRSPKPRANNDEKYMETIDMTKPHFSNKYLLTKTIKSVDENLSGGSKVTLLCKTFTLSERSRKNLYSKQKTNIEPNSSGKSSKKNTKSSTRRIKY